MTPTWDDEVPLPDLSIRPLGWIVLVLRLCLIVPMFLVGIVISLLFHGIERVLTPGRHPLSSRLTRLVFIVTLRIIGFRVRVIGRPARGGGAVVANHSSWLDILVLNAPGRVHFAAKSEVEGWPVIGFLARLAGTLFIKRERREAATQVAQFRDRLSRGQTLCFFPEGTSTDGMRVLPFKPTLFAAFFDDALRDRMRVQPVSVVYRAPPGRDARFYGWYGDMDMAPSFIAVLGTLRQGGVELTYHEAVAITDFADRKMLAAHCEAAVRGPVLKSLVDD